MANPVLVGGHRAQRAANLPVHLTPLNPVSFLLRAALISPTKIALTHPEARRQWTYLEWSHRVSALAHALLSRKIKPNDKVAVLAPNVPFLADALQACPAIGAVIVPVNIRLTKPEVEYILKHSQAKLVLVDSQFKHLVSGCRLPTIVAGNGTGKDEYEAFLELGRRSAKGKGWQGIKLLADEDAALSLCYTSGTTGRPKGVIGTHRGSFLAAVSNALESGLTNDSVYLWILPMFHCCGWTFPWACTAVQATQVCLRSVGQYDEVWDYLRNDVTHYCGAPTVQLSILNHPSAREAPLSRKITTLVAGAAPTASLLQGLEAIGIDCCHVYGLTESYGPFMRNYAKPEWKQMTSDQRSRMQARQGHAFLAACEVQVVKMSPPGSVEEVPWDGKTIGEIVMRGNIVMKEYYRDPEATAKAFAGGVFRTGDLAVRFPDGSVSIQDRSKDIIISGGENASSLFIESELAAHPDVLECAVVARAHPKYGERPHAFVVLRPLSKKKWEGQDFTTELKAFVKNRLPGFARPEWVEMVDQLEKTSTGKIQKHELRKRFPKL